MLSNIQLPSENEDLKVLLCQIQREVEKLVSDTNAQLLIHDGKIAECVNYLKNNLSNSIRHLLDDMKYTGELDKLITETLMCSLNKRVIFIDTVNDLKNSILQAGDVVQTLGYYEINDGGKSTYKIREKTLDDIEDNGLIHYLPNGKVAELILENTINPIQFGAKGDGKTDDTESFKNMLNSNDFLTITSPADKTYVINEKLSIKPYQEFDFNNSVLTTTNEGLDFILDIFTDYNPGKILHNLVIDCNNLCGGIYIDYSTTYTIEHITLKNVKTYGIYVKQGNIIGKNLFFINTSNNDATGIYLKGTDSKFYDVLMRDFRVGIENRSGINYFTGVHVWLSSQFEIDNSIGIIVGGQTSLTNCYIDTYDTAIVNDNNQLLLVEGLKVYINPDNYNLKATKSPTFIKFIQSINGKDTYPNGASLTYLYSFNIIMNSDYTPIFSNCELNDIMKYLPLKKISQNRSPFDLVDYYLSELEEIDSNFSASENTLKEYDDRYELRLRIIPNDVSSFVVGEKVTVTSKIPFLCPNTITKAQMCSNEGVSHGDVNVRLISTENAKALNLIYIDNPQTYGISYKEIIMK